ncbi:MAG: hypothetical protein JSW60_02850, partial [Thermoplasmatales archaeon]
MKIIDDCERNNFDVKMNRRIITILGVLFVACIIVGSSSIERTIAKNFNAFNKDLIDENENYNLLENITLKDDAFHKTYDFYHVETWYFDAVFDNNYSVALNVMVIQKGNHGIVLIGLYLYENTNLIFHQRKLHLYKYFSASEEKPILKLYNKTIIKGDVDSETNRWIYDVSTAIDGQAVNLHFVNNTNGWKTDTRMGWWLVLPRFNVTGWLLLNGKN